MSWFNWFGWFNKKHDDVPVAELVTDVVRDEISPSHVMPLAVNRDSYIKHAQNLKTAIRSGDVKKQKFFRKYLCSNGLRTCNSVDDCDALIREVNGWLRTQRKSG